MGWPPGPRGPYRKRLSDAQREANKREAARRNNAISKGIYTAAGGVRSVLREGHDEDDAAGHSNRAIFNLGNGGVWVLPKRRYTS